MVYHCGNLFFSNIVECFSVCSSLIDFLMQYLFMLLSILNWSIFYLFLNSNLSSFYSLATNLKRCMICRVFFYGVPFLHIYWCLFNFDKIQLLNICSSCTFSVTSKNSV